MDKKVNIELRIIGQPEESTFLNYWNCFNGDDVCCELKDGKLKLSSYNDDTDDVEYKNEITLEEFIDLVKERIQ